VSQPHLCLLGDANSVHLQRWAREMIARGFRVSVVTARPQEIAGVEQCVLSPVHRSVDWLRRVGEARRFVERLAPDIVHAHYVSSYGYLAARCARHPLVMTAWGSDLLLTPRHSTLMRWLTGWTLRRADLITGDSLDLVAAAQAYHPRAPLHCIHWGADTAKFRPASWADKPAFDIASLRSWEPNYRIDTLVGAVGLLREWLPDAPVHLHLLGGGSGEAALREQVRSLGLTDRVTFHGRVDDAGMLAVLSRCKVSVSVPASDATSVALLESMACGLAVVASDLPANRQWLSGADDLLVPSGDATALARALQTLLQDDARTQQLGTTNLERIERDGQRAAQMDAMAGLYRELLARVAGSRSA
jgi:glycosyltransferase involved in cell wall biosynthesis